MEMAWGSIIEATPSKAVNSTRDMQGGAGNILINDDDSQLVSRSEVKFEEHHIGFVYPA